MFFSAFISLNMVPRKCNCFGSPILFTRWSVLFSRQRSQTLVVQTLESAIQWITQFGFPNTYPVKRDLRGGAVQGQDSENMTCAALTRSIGNPNNSGARAHSGAPWVRKFVHTRNCGCDKIVRLSVNLCFSGTNQKPERRRPFGTGLVRHCPQGLFSPFFTFLRAIYFSARLDFFSSPLSAPGSPRMISNKRE